MTWAAERRAAEQQQTRAVLARAYADPIAGPEHDHLAGGEDLSGHADFAFDDVEAPVFVIVRHGQTRAGREFGVDIECLAEDLRGRAFAVGVAEYDAQPDAFGLQHGQRFAPVMLEAGG